MQYHAAKQNVTCPGCYSIFGEASHLIRHFEQNKCEQISYRTYVGYVTHQHVNAQIKKDENKYIEGLLVNDQFAGPSDRSPLAVVGPAISDHDGEDEDEGGIILDHDDEAQWAGIKPLVPQASSTTRATSNTIAWLSLSRSDELTEGFSNMIISPGPDWRRGGDTAGGDWQRSVEPTESCPVLRSALKKTNSTAVSAGGDGEASAWTIGATSKALFKDAKPTPPRPGAWNDIVKQRKEAALGPHIDVTRLRFWDPSAKEYNVDRFLHSVTLKYCCPFPECGCDYEAPGELEEHLQIGHLRTDFHCPGCLKRFPLGSSLIAHAEASNGRCKVRNASYFNKLLEQVSGGFLSAEELYQPKVHKVNQSALARRGDVVEGVMDTKFTAHMPTELQK